MNERELTEHERTTLVTALHTAALYYDNLVKETNVAFELARVVEQFKHQAKEARILADVIEGAEEISIKERST